MLSFFIHCYYVLSARGYIAFNKYLMNLINYRVRRVNNKIKKTQIIILTLLYSLWLCRYKFNFSDFISVITE